MTDLVEQLINVGLTQYEARTYYVLLQKNEIKATQLSKLADVPRTRIYEVLNNLNSKGFCVDIPGKVKKFKAISPQFAFTDLIESYELDLGKKREAIAELSEELQPIYDLSKDRDNNWDNLEVILERNHILEKINEIGSSAQSEILTMNKAPYATNFERAIERGKADYFQGLNYKFIAEKSDMRNPSYCRFMELWEKNGAEIRVVEEVPIKLVIFDRKQVILSLSNDPGKANKFTSMYIDNLDMAKMYVKTFELYFSEGITIKQFLEEQKENPK